MIKDLLENADLYYNLNANIKEGLQWLKNNDLETMPDGRYNISDTLYANIQTYETKEDALFEAHRKYIDIQYIIKGYEKIGVTQYKNSKCSKPYDSETDIEFLSSNNGDYLSLNQGEFLILFPNDAHKPSLTPDKKQFVKKVVVKVAI